MIVTDETDTARQQQSTLDNTMLQKQLSHM
jgi:hypothetical protein